MAQAGAKRPPRYVQPRLLDLEAIQEEAIRRLAQRTLAQRAQDAPVTHAALLAARAFRQAYSLHDFVREAWALIEPQPFVDGWHLEALCAHLQAVTETAAATDAVPYDGPKIRNLLVSVPPRTSKSLVSSVMWPCWAWLSWPACRWLFASYSKDLALRDAVYARTLMSTDWYEEHKFTPWHFTTDQRIKSFYGNTAQGYRITTSVSAMATGVGGDVRVGDDLHATQEDFSTSRAEINAAKQFWLITMASRFTDAKRSCQVLVGQRVAVDDVSAEVLKQGDYAHLKIPMEYELEHAAPPTPLGWVDPRTTAGELLAPQRFGPPEVAELKRRLGHRYFTQFQQRPQSELSSIFPRSRWKFYHTLPPLDWFDVLIQSWDYRFGEAKQSGSYVAGHLWGRHGPPATGDVFLLDRVFARLSFEESVDATVALAEKWPGAYAKLIEQAANGHAIFSTLRRKVFGLVLVPVGGQYSSKIARAEAEAFVLKEGRAWLPHPTLAAWSEEYMTNMEQFPGEPTDDTDATSQAWAHLCPPQPATNVPRKEAAERTAFERQLMIARQTRGRGLARAGTGA